MCKQKKYGFGDWFSCFALFLFRNKLYNIDMKSFCSSSPCVNFNVSIYLEFYLKDSHLCTLFGTILNEKPLGQQERKNELVLLNKTE